ncbi:MAG: diguanylate cyclase [Clostridiales bacterium]|nr:diguanylate cyclase [Clostridiales bacterium]
MNITSVIIVNVYSILILTIIYYHSIKYNGNQSLVQKLYHMIVLTTALMLLLDIFSRLDGNYNTLYPALNQFGHFMVFLLSPAIPSIWLLFVYYYVFPEVKNRWLIYILLAVNSIHVGLLIFSMPHKWFYYIDSFNIYHRGPLYIYSASTSVVLLLIAYIFVFVNNKRINKRQYYSLLLFPMPPFICIVLQLIFYGVSIILNSMVISILIVYLNVQNHSMYIDYLTDVYNRKKLEIYLKDKISASTINKSFSAIMIDVNDFKSINDTFGHYTGDEALQLTAKLLRSCLRSNDFIARFGGDEFIIILDSSDSNYLESIVDRINNCLKQHNESGNRPYRLGLSIGYTVYDCNSQMKAESLLHQIDSLMYENKRLSKRTEGRI